MQPPDFYLNRLDTKRGTKRLLPGLMMGMLLSFLLISSPSVYSKPKKEDPGPHPLQVIKAKLDTFGRSRYGGDQRGTVTVWIKNNADLPVDGVVVEVEFYSSQGRLLGSFKKKVGEIEGKERSAVSIKWDLIGEDETPKPKIWVYYNGGGPEPKKFIGEPPLW